MQSNGLRAGVLSAGVILVAVLAAPGVSRIDAATRADTPVFADSSRAVLAALQGDPSLLPPAPVVETTALANGALTFSRLCLNLTWRFEWCRKLLWWLLRRF